MGKDGGGGKGTVACPNGPHGQQSGVVESFPLAHVEQHPGVEYMSLEMTVQLLPNEIKLPSAAKAPGMYAAERAGDPVSGAVLSSTWSQCN
jgi:hypothetical protein